MTTRFMANHNGEWITVSLKDGEVRTFERGGAHKEGYSYTTTTYTNLGDGLVMREIESSGRDCDGRHNTYSCELADDMTASSFGYVKTPNWVWESRYRAKVAA